MYLTARRLTKILYTKIDSLVVSGSSATYFVALVWNHDSTVDSFAVFVPLKTQGSVLIFSLRHKSQAVSTSERTLPFPALVTLELAHSRKCLLKIPLSVPPCSASRRIEYHAFYHVAIM
jgi:hypothetical protein